MNEMQCSVYAFIDVAACSLAVRRPGMRMALRQKTHNVSSYYVSESEPDENAIKSTFFSARQHAERAICYRKSVRLSVCHTGGSVENG